MLPLALESHFRGRIRTVVLFHLVCGAQHEVIPREFMGRTQKEYIFKISNITSHQLTQTLFASLIRLSLYQLNFPPESFGCQYRAYSVYVNRPIYALQGLNSELCIHVNLHLPRNLEKRYQAVWRYKTYLLL